MMVKIGKKIVKYRVVVFILGLLLLIPSALGYLKTRVNYDILYYLPDNIETMKGQDILMKDFGKGAFAMEVVEGTEIIRQGNKFGVKIRSHAPTIHLIKANIETEIAPIVGSEQQAEDLIRYIKDRRETEGGIWETNIFGKTIEELVMDGMQSRIAMIGDDSQAKLQDTMQKVVNDINGGMVCIII